MRAHAILVLGCGTDGGAGCVSAVIQGKLKKAMEEVLPEK